MTLKKHVKLFEDHERDGFVYVGKDFDKKLKDYAEMQKTRNKNLEPTPNNFKMRLFYEIKGAINDYMDGRSSSWDEQSDADRYAGLIHYDVKGVFYMFSEGKYASIKVEDIPKAKQMLMDVIEKHIPYTKAKYAPYNEVKAVVDEFVDKLVADGIFNPEKGFVWDEEAKEKPTEEQ